MPEVPDESSWSREADGIADRTLEENWLFRLRRERFRSRTSDRVHDFYVMHLADAVHAIALTPDDRMVLVRQFRAGSRHDSLEPPGGLLDPGEDPCQARRPRAARRDGLCRRPPHPARLPLVEPLDPDLEDHDNRDPQRSPRRPAEARPQRGSHRCTRPRRRDPPHDPGRPDRSCALRRRAPVVAPGTCGLIEERMNHKDTKNTKKRNSLKTE